jgi:Leucine-rich repeat (LRR) protein
MKKKIFTILVFLFAVSYYNAQKLTFNDKSFEKAVVTNFDLNKDGAIDQSEAEKVVSLFVSNKIQVRSAEDINLFKNVQTIVLDGSIMIAIDLKNLNNLTLFSCEACNLLTFKGENLKSLKSLYLNNNKLTQISLKNTPEINELIVSSNTLQNIDVSALNKLITLNLENNQIKKLDVSQNPNLESLNINNNPLTEADIKRGKTVATPNSSVGSSIPANPSTVPMNPSPAPQKKANGNKK